MSGTQTTPADETHLDRSITACLAGRAADEILLVTEDRTLSAGACQERVTALARELSRLGVGANDRVATLTHLSADSVLLWWALDHLGAVYLPLNPAWTPRLLRRVLEDRRPVALLVDPGLRSVAQEGAGTVAVRELPLGGSAPGSGEPLRAAVRDPLADCAIVHNSGLPGIHRGVRVSPRMLAVMGTAMVPAEPGDRVLVAGPTCFMGTLVSIYGAIAAGGAAALLPNLTADTFWPAMRRAGVTFAAPMNPTLADLMARPESAEDRDHPVALMAAPAGQPELSAAAARRFGVRCMSGLAKTEVCGAVSTGLDPAATEGVGRVRPPFIGQIVAIDDGRVLGPGSPGELVLRCEVEGGLPLGYADDPAGSAALWRGGWMHTGWNLSRDSDGCLHPEGNLSVHPLVAKRAGYMFAADLEAEIVSVGDGVTGARVLARPGVDADADPMVIAWVTGEVDERRLRRTLRAGLPAHLVPDLVVPVAQLPAAPEAASVPADGAWTL